MSGDFWFTADPHFGHHLVSEIRGFSSVKDHDEAILDAICSTVQKGDNIFFLGDVMLPFKQEAFSKILEKIPGQKHLILGNHDPTKKHEQLVGRKGGNWVWVGHIRARKIDSTPFFLCHYACRSWPGMGRGVIHLYGHSHGNLAPDYGRSMDVGVDTKPGSWEPWHIDEVREVMEKVPVLVVDHHDEDEGKVEE